MKFIRLNRETLDQGHAVFDDYLRSALCGKGDREGYLAGKNRRGGVAALPGALVACLDSGILDVSAVICGVARATRCRQSTVESFLRDVAGVSSDLRHFSDEEGAMLEQRLLASNTLIAA